MIYMKRKSKHTEERSMKKASLILDRNYVVGPVDRRLFG